MTLIAAYVRHGGAQRRLCDALRHSRQDIAVAPSWEGFLRVVRERPVGRAIVDLGAFDGELSAHEALAHFHDLFPFVPVILVARRSPDAVTLFRAGRAGAAELVLFDVDPVDSALRSALARAGDRSTPAHVLRAVSPHLPRRESMAVRLALEHVHRCWSAEAFADEVGLARPFLSECLKETCLPSAGHLLIWIRLLHAGRWLSEPGRTGESVSRQLEYSSGAAFRRALRSYTGATPTEVAESGGLSFVLDRFLDTCGFAEPGRTPSVSVA